METIDLIVNGFHHQASLHRSVGNRVNKTIVYYHGGGFIFGSKDDLPAYAIEKLTSAGYDLLCMEYPKAPEMSLNMICDFAENQLIWFQNNHKMMNLSLDYILFGRSAGGYLILHLAKRMAMLNRKIPYKLIVFYGYETLNMSEIILPNEHYGKYPSLHWDDVKHAIEEKPVFTTSLLKRYPLYVYARQTGNWLKLLGIDQNRQVESSLESKIFDYPGIFLAASHYDKDVSYQNSLSMSQKYDHSILFTSWQDKHEFDKLETAESQYLYKRLLEWISID